MSIRIKDFIVGKQKEDGMKGADAYAYARQQETITAANPHATERVTKLRYSIPGYLCGYGSLLAMGLGYMGLGILLIVPTFVFGIFGKVTATEQPIRR